MQKAGAAFSAALSSYFAYDALRMGVEGYQMLANAKTNEDYSAGGELITNAAFIATGTLKSMPHNIKQYKIAKFQTKYDKMEPQALIELLGKQYEEIPRSALINTLKSKGYTVVEQPIMQGSKPIGTDTRVYNKNGQNIEIPTDVDYLIDEYNKYINGGDLKTAKQIEQKLCSQGLKPNADGFFEHVFDINDTSPATLEGLQKNLGLIEFQLDQKTMDALQKSASPDETVSIYRSDPTTNRVVYAVFTDGSGKITRVRVFGAKSGFSTTIVNQSNQIGRLTDLVKNEADAFKNATCEKIGNAEKWTMEESSGSKRIAIHDDNGIIIEYTQKADNTIKIVRSRYSDIETSQLIKDMQAAINENDTATVEVIKVELTSRGYKIEYTKNAEGKDIIEITKEKSTDNTSQAVQTSQTSQASPMNGSITNYQSGSICRVEGASGKAYVIINDSKGNVLTKMESGGETNGRVVESAYSEYPYEQLKNDLVKSINEEKIPQRYAITAEFVRRGYSIEFKDGEVVIKDKSPIPPLQGNKYIDPFIQKAREILATNEYDVEYGRTDDTSITYIIDKKTGQSVLEFTEYADSSIGVDVMERTWENGEEVFSKVTFSDGHTVEIDWDGEHGEQVRKDASGKIIPRIKDGSSGVALALGIPAPTPVVDYFTKTTEPKPITRTDYESGRPKVEPSGARVNGGPSARGIYMTPTRTFTPEESGAYALETVENSYNLKGLTKIEEPYDPNLGIRKLSYLGQDGKTVVASVNVDLKTKMIDISTSGDGVLPKFDAPPTPQAIAESLKSVFPNDGIIGVISSHVNSSNGNTHYDFTLAGKKMAEVVMSPNGTVEKVVELEYSDYGFLNVMTVHDKNGQFTTRSKGDSKFSDTTFEVSVDNDGNIKNLKIGYMDNGFVPYYRADGTLDALKTLKLNEGAAERNQYAVHTMESQAQPASAEPLTGIPVRPNPEPTVSSQQQAVPTETQKGESAASAGKTTSKKTAAAKTTKTTKTKATKKTTSQQKAKEVNDVFRKNSVASDELKQFIESFAANNNLKVEYIGKSSIGCKDQKGVRVIKIDLEEDGSISSMSKVWSKLFKYSKAISNELSKLDDFMLHRSGNEIASSLESRAGFDVYQTIADLEAKAANLTPKVSNLGTTKSIEYFDENGHCFKKSRVSKDGTSETTYNNPNLKDIRVFGDKNGKVFAYVIDYHRKPILMNGKGQSISFLEFNNIMNLDNLIPESALGDPFDFMKIKYE